MEMTGDIFTCMVIPWMKLVEHSTSMVEHRLSGTLKVPRVNAATTIIYFSTSRLCQTEQGTDTIEHRWTRLPKHWIFN